MTPEISYLQQLFDTILQTPTLIGLFGSWVLTQMAKFAYPVEWDHFRRRARTMYTAFLTGLALTVIAHMVPPPGASEWVVVPPFSSILAGLIVGGFSPYAWDLALIPVIRRLNPVFAERLSAKVKTQVHQVEVDGEPVYLRIALSPENDVLRVQVIGEEEA